MEELKFEKLSEVPVIEKLTDNDFVMAVQDGEIVRISKNEVGSAEKRELLLDFNFSTEDATGQIMESISKQLSDLLTSPSTETEVELEFYGIGYDQETDNETIIDDRIGFLRRKINGAYAQNFPIQGASSLTEAIEVGELMPCMDIQCELHMDVMIDIISGMIIPESSEEEPMPQPGDGGILVV